MNKTETRVLIAAQLDDFVASGKTITLCKKGKRDKSNTSFYPARVGVSYSGERPKSLVKTKVKAKRNDL
jgi:hypothetical protein